LAACQKHSLARLEIATWWLDLNEVAILDLIADRALVAFNLAGPHTLRRLPGIWCQSLNEFQQVRAALNNKAPSALDPAATTGLRKRLCRTVSASSASLRKIRHSTVDVLADILPPGRRDLHFREVLRALGIKRHLLHDLLQAALLATVPGTGDKVSRAPLITRASVVDFLTARRM
jgi:hypothetical protein